MKVATSTSAASSTLFSEQVGHVIELFQDWNDCERSVSLFAVLKRIPFSCTKFLQSVIDANLTQAYGCEQSKQLEHNANSVSFVRALHEAYRCLEGGASGGAGAPTTTTSSCSISNHSKHSNKDSLFGESDHLHHQFHHQNHHNHTSGHANHRRGSCSTTASSGLDANSTVPAAAAATTATPTHKASPAGGYDRKEAILGDILTLMPILTPGNEEAKSAYLELIPATVEDAIRGQVNTSLVQQIFSYVLIHPAFSADDRRSLNKVLRHLEDHIVSTDPNFVLFPASPTHTAGHGTPSGPPDSSGGPPSAATSTTHSTATLSSASAPHIAAINSWQAIVPPTGSSSKSSETIHSTWMDGGIVHHQHINGHTPGAAGTSSMAHKASSNPATLNGADYGAGVVDFQSSPALLNAGGGAVGGQSMFEPTGGATGGVDAVAGHSATDDHHISFSKNGTEIIDFDADDTDKSNTQIGFDTLANLNEFLTVPGVFDNVAMKTRRSNSLTTAAAAGCRIGSIGSGSSSSGGGGATSMGGRTSFGNCLSASMATGNGHSGSAQNLSHMMLQKPRSFSLSSGSDTRLDDFRSAMQQQQQQQSAAGGGFGAADNGCAIGPAGGCFMKFGGTSPSATAGTSSSHNVGMANIGQWLKSLRLHKYVWLFSNITYEQMLAISEEYLQQLNVTKGARHKLVMCIQRLKDRHGMLCQLEKELMVGRESMAVALDELTGVVLTPMRPVEPYNKQDVGGQFLRVLNLVSNMVINKHITPQDEEAVNTLLWILEKAVHNEAFVAHTNQLKEHRYKVSRIKAQFPPKPHFVPAAAGGAVASTSTASLSNIGIGSTSASSLSSSAASVVVGAQPNEAAIAGNMSRSRFECTIAPSKYHDLTPTSSMAPWRTSQWAAPPSARRLPVFDPHHQHHSGGANHQTVNHDSDYHSMTSSQSNSTESLDQLLSAVTRTSFVEKLDFDRAISKPLSGHNTPIIRIHPSPSQPNDFLNTPQLTQLTALPTSGTNGCHFANDDGCSRSCSSDDTPPNDGADANATDDTAECKQRMYARRDSFNGLTDHSIRPKIGALFLNQQLQDFATPTTSTHNSAPHNPRTILRRQDSPPTTSVVLPNMSVPPPHYFATVPPPTEQNTACDIPVFDATKPPPTFVPRSVLAVAMTKPPPQVVEASKVELYRPREMRLTPQQNVQPPSSATNGSSSSSKPLQMNAPVFVPGSAPKRPTPAVSKIAAKFTEAPIFLPVQDYPALISPAQSSRYIVKQTAETLYHTPVQTSASTAAAAACAQQSLASIVRTTLPKLMAQQQKTPLPTGVEEATTDKVNIAAAAAATTPAADDADHNDDGLGMSNVNGWLKSLRLHKYVWLFANMSYTQMLRIDDAYLERRQITKGARNKLALSVQKLRERYETLDRIEKELLSGSAQLSDALDELTAVAQTPMRPMQPFVVNDVATKLMKLVNMVYEKMSRSLMVHPDDQCVGKLGWLLDVVMHSEGCSTFHAQLRRMRQRSGGDKKSYHMQQYQR